MKIRNRMLSFMLCLGLTGSMLPNSAINASIETVRLYNIKSSVLGASNYDNAYDTNDDGIVNVFDVIRTNKEVVQGESYNDLKNKVSMLEKQIQSLIEQLSNKEESKGNEFSAEDKAKLDSLENYDDTEIKKQLEGLHNYDDTEIREKLDSLSNYDDTEIKKQLEGLHNYDDTEIREKLDSLSNYDDTEIKKQLEGLHNYDDTEIREKLDSLSNYDDTEIKKQLEGLHNYDDTEIREKLDSLSNYDDTDIKEGKVDKEEGKGLSSNDFTNEDKQNLEDIIRKINLNDRFNTRSKIYGVSINNNNGTVTRIADASDLKNDYVVGDSFRLNDGNNDFDNVFPWCDMRLCNVKIVDDRKIVTYENENGFALDGTNGDVMVEIPKYYTFRDVNGEIETICISGEKKSGFELEPVFYDSETGEELNHVYCGAYLSSIENGKHTSKTGTQPTTSKTLLEFRECGEMYDFAMIQALQKLMTIEFGKINLSQDMGGLSFLPFHGDAKAYEDSLMSNTGVFYSKVYGTVANIDNLFVGANISVTNKMGVVENRKIISLGEKEDCIIDNNLYHKRSVTFSGDPVDIIANKTLIYCYAQDNGLSDGLTYHTGRRGITNVSTADQFKYRNIEGIWGNVGEMIDGVRLRNLEYYYSYSKNDYNDINKYTKLSYNSVEQNQYDFRKSFILKMGFDRLNPSVNLPVMISENGDGKDYEYYGDIFCAYYLKGDGDTTFEENTEFIGISSMAWDGNTRNGPYMYRFWSTENGYSWLYGTRMIYRTK